MPNFVEMSLSIFKLQECKKVKFNIQFFVHISILFTQILTDNIDAIYSSQVKDGGSPPKKRAQLQRQWDLPLLRPELDFAHRLRNLFWSAVALADR